MLVEPRVAVVGSINMDLVVRCAQLPVPGETILASSFSQIPGGKGANQAVAAARLGASVTMIGRVGDDTYGTQLRESLNHEQIDTAFVKETEKCASGIAIIAVEQSGENSILVVPGANSRLAVADVTAAADVIRASDVLLLQLEIPLEPVVAAIHIAQRSGIRIILDPAPALTPFSPELFGVDIICPNRGEAAAILGREIISNTDVEEAALDLAFKGAKFVIITLGDKGAAASDGKTVQWFPPLTISSVDTTAAGDAFAGALAVRWAERNKLRDAVRFACAAGALAASRAGAQPAMPRREEIDLLLNRLD